MIIMPIRAYSSKRFEQTIERATGRAIEEIRREPFPVRTEYDMAQVPRDLAPGLLNHAQCKEAYQESIMALS